MPFYYTSRIAILSLLILSLTGCDFWESVQKWLKKPTENVEIARLTLAVAPQIAWMPWYLADEEGTFQEHASAYNLEVQFVSDNYQDAIEKFINEEVEAIAITNIDAIAQLVRRDIEADVILITNYSNGNEAILLPSNADTNVRNIRGKKFALVQNSARHYLLDRYLVRNQIPFEDVTVLNTPEVDIPAAFVNKDVYGVVTSNPNVHKLIKEADAKILFDSREIFGEIFDMIVVRRDTLIDHPKFAQVLLATWFAMMERLQGNKKGPTLDSMARLANLSREEYDEEIAMTPLNDTSTKALSAIRAHRRMRKAMRHIRYFVERHELSGSEIFTGWVSYPGRTPALLHFNGEPLQDFVAPPET